MRLMLVVHPDRAEAKDVADRMAARAEELGLDVVERSEVAAGDVVVTIGGDGTFLVGARHAIAAGAAVLGVDVGDVGYLAEVEPERALEAVERLAGGEHSVVERSTIEVSWDGGRAVGVNDAVVEKVVSQHALRLEMEIDGTPYIDYRADGLIVATPVGSTAYAFSAGGPIVHPDAAVLVLAAVAPHNLDRAIVLPATSEVAMVVAGGRPARINVDGEEAAIVQPGGEIVVRRGGASVRMVSMFAPPFASNVRTKLRFGAQS